MSQKPLKGSKSTGKNCLIFLLASTEAQTLSQKSKSSHWRLKLGSRGGVSPGRKVAGAMCYGLDKVVTKNQGIVL